MNPENLCLIFFQEACRGAYFTQPDDSNYIREEHK